MKHFITLKKLSLCVCACLFLLNCSKDEQESETQTSFYIPEGVITTDEAQDLNKAWQEKNAALFNKAGASKFENQHQSFWWSLEDLRNYLAYAEQEAQDKGYTMDGVRVYLAAYPEKDGQNTLFFAPTGRENYSKASTINFSFGNSGNIPVSPLNRGHGGTGDYNL
ncbi:hypothetical protein [Tamlana sp. I1]|uniref:hypothetical protein n=1 Tax=Tamlana sp. I1 TaxID=2762061 RepID=UPI00188DE461|nr:hypothetical protein [Tamlana sp. I1]